MSYFCNLCANTSIFLANGAFYFLDEACRTYKRSFQTYNKSDNVIWYYFQKTYKCYFVAMIITNK